MMREMEGCLLSLKLLGDEGFLWLGEIILNKTDRKKKGRVSGRIKTNAKK